MPSFERWIVNTSLRSSPVTYTSISPSMLLTIGSAIDKAHCIVGVSMFLLIL